MYNDDVKHSLLIVNPICSLNEFEEYLQRNIKVIIFCPNALDVLKSIKKDTHLYQLKKYLDKRYLQIYYCSPSTPENVINDGKQVEQKYLKDLGDESSKDGISGYTSFNAEQYIVEHSKERNILVTAGAGSGKTHVMVDRILYLMDTDENFDFSRVALMSFTNNSATDIKASLRKALKIRLTLAKGVEQERKCLDNYEQVTKANISTIDTMFNKIYRDNAHLLGISRDVRQTTLNYETKKIISSQIDKLYDDNKEQFERLFENFERRYIVINLCKEIIDELNKYGLSFDDKISCIRNSFLESNNNGYFDQLIATIVLKTLEEYEQYRQENNVTTLDDVKGDLQKILDDKRRIFDYDYVFCDEFQDANPAQIKIISKLANGNNLFVVGDIKQAIYRFRGAKSNAFEALEEELETVTKYELSKNYRTDGNILNKLENYFNVWGKQGLLPFSEEKDKLIAQKWYVEGSELDTFDDDKDYRKLIQKIRNIINQNKSKNTSIALLVRKNTDIDTIAKKLKKEFGGNSSVLLHFTQKGGFYNSDAVADLMAYISVLAFPNVPMYQFRYILSPYGPFKSLKQADLDSFIEDGKVDKVLSKIIAGDESLQKDLKMLRKIPLLSLVSNRIHENGHIAVKYAQFLLYRTNLDKNTIKANSRQYAADIVKLMQILETNIDKNSSDITNVYQFLKIKIETDSTESPAEISQDIAQKKFITITGTTVHKSKGLEYDYVFLPKMDSPFESSYSHKITVLYNKNQIAWKLESKGLSSNNFTKLNEIEHKEVMCDETRLLYVAVTRAKKGLYYNIGKNNKNTWSNLMSKDSDK